MAVKPLSKMMVVLAALIAAAGCGGSPLKVGDGGASGSAGQSRNAGQNGSVGEGGSAPGCNNAPCPQPAGPCDMLLDEKSCAAHPECEELHCPDCKGGQTFVSCTEPDGGLIVDCGCPTALSCNSIDEATCKTRSDCETDYCPACGGGQTFVGCEEPGGGTACAAIACAHACGTIMASDYDQSCASDADCVTVPEGDFCDANRCTDCPNAVVSIRAQAQYEADLASKISKPFTCPCPSGPTAVCNNGRCETGLLQ